MIISAAGSEHPQDRAELGGEHTEALAEELAYPFGSVGEARASDAVARRFDCKLEAIGHGFGPGGPALRALAAVKGSVDLDRADLRRSESELASLGKAGGIEVAAPRRIGPAADTDADDGISHGRRVA